MNLYQKQVYEARFPGQIDIFDGRKEIVKLFYPQRFPNWAIKEHTIRLHDSKSIETSMESMFVTHQRTGYSLEDPQSPRQFMDKALSHHKRLTAQIPIPSYTRIGVRGFVKLGYCSKDEFMNMANGGKVFSATFGESLVDQLGYDDIQVTLQGSTTKVVFGPMGVDEEHPYTLEFVVRDSMKNDYIMIDIDCFRHDVSGKRFEAEFQALFNQMISIRDVISGYFGDLLHA